MAVVVIISFFLFHAEYFHKVSIKWGQLVDEETAEERDQLCICAFCIFWSTVLLVHVRIVVVVVVSSSIVVVVVVVVVVV